MPHPSLPRVADWLSSVLLSAPTPQGSLGLLAWQWGGQLLFLAASTQEAVLLTPGRLASPCRANAATCFSTGLVWVIFDSEPS